MYTLFLVECSTCKDTHIIPALSSFDAFDDSRRNGHEPARVPVSADTGDPVLNADVDFALFTGRPLVDCE